MKAEWEVYLYFECLLDVTKLAESMTGCQLLKFNSDFFNKGETAILANHTLYHCMPVVPLLNDRAKRAVEKHKEET